MEIGVQAQILGRRMLCSGWLRGWQYTPTAGTARVQSVEKWSIFSEVGTALIADRLLEDSAYGLDGADSMTAPIVRPRGGDALRKLMAFA